LRNCVGLLLGNLRRLSDECDDDIHPQPHQIGRQFGQSVEVAIRPSVFESNVLSLDIAELVETLEQAINIAGLRPFGAEHPDNSHRRPLRASQERPSRSRTPDEENEFPSPHRLPSFREPTTGD
jgi:hypothetical protein